MQLTPLGTFAGGNFVGEIKGDGTIVYSFYDQQGALLPFIEARTVAGEITRYELFRSVNDKRDYRVVEFIDAYDNSTVYSYDSSDRILTVARPDGISEQWNYSPSWVSGWGSNYSGVEITYFDRASNQLLSDQTYYMVFKKPGSGPMLGDKLFRVYRAKTPKLAPLSGAIGATEYGVPTGALPLQHEVFEFTYSGLLTTKIEHLTAADVAFGSTESVKQTVAEYTYVLVGDRSRVETENLPMLDRFRSYTYWEDLLEPSRIDRVDVAEAGSGTIVETYLDDNQRPTKVLTRPVNNAVGRPRANDSVNNEQGSLAEPTEVWTEFEYSGCTSCSSKPSKVTEMPSGRVFEFDYDNVTGLLLKERRPKPTGASGFAETSYVWAPLVVGDTYGTHRLQNATYPDGKVWTHEYDVVARPTPSGQVSRGMKVTSHRSKTPAITGVGILEREAVYNATTPTTVQGLQVGLVGQVTKTSGNGLSTVLAFDALGLLTSVTENSAGLSSEVIQTVFVPDRAGRPLQVTTNASSTLSLTMTISYNADGSVAASSGQVGAQPIGAKYYYDQWGNLAVKLRRNATSSGSTPDDFGAAPRSDVARQWLHDEFQYSGPRLVATLQDRRSLDRSDSGDFTDLADARFLLTTYAWTPEGLLASVYLPNGSEVKHTYDGYGSLYKTERIGNGGQAVLDGKYFINQSFELVREVREVTAQGRLVTKIIRNAAGVVEEIVEPEPVLLGGWYSGPTTHAVLELDTDIMGRTVESRIRDGVTSSLVLQRTALVYDEIGRVVQTHHFDPPSASTPSQTYATTWDGWDRVKRVDGPGGRFQDRLFDGLGRVREQWDSRPGNPNRVVYEYSANARFLKKVQNLNWDEHPSVGAQVQRDVEYEVDGLGRVLKIKQGASPALESAFSYYATGETESYADPSGKIERYLPDALGRLVERFLPGTQPIWNASAYYDWTGTNDRTELRQLDGLGNVTKTVFDFAGRTQMVMEPGSVAEPTIANPSRPFARLMVYDGASRLQDLYAGDGIKVSYAWDGVGRLLGRWSPTPSMLTPVSWLHGADSIQRDALGRAVYSVSASGANGGGGAYVQESASFDALGRTLSESYNFLGTSNWVSVGATYTGGDPLRTGLTYQNNLGPNTGDLAMQFLPDAVGRMQEVSWQTTGAMRPVARYFHEGGATRRKVTSWGATTGQNFNTDYRYDSYGRMDKIEQSFDALATVDFAYDSASNLLKETYNGHLTATTYSATKGDRFAYDEHHRLWKAWLGSDQNHIGQADPEQPTGMEPPSDFIKKLTYGLDAANNRGNVATQLGASGSPTTETYEVDDVGPGSNRYKEVNGVSMLYDERGNTTFDGNYYYVYDEQNRLSEVYILVETDMAQAGAQTMLATDPETGSTSEVAESGKFLVTNPDALKTARANILTLAANNLSEFIQRHNERPYAAQFKQVLSPLSVQPETQPASNSSSSPSFNVTQMQLVSLYLYDVSDRRVVRMVMGSGETRFTAWDGWQEAQELSPTQDNPPKAAPVKQFLWGEQLDELVAYRTKTAGGWNEYYVAEGGAHCPQRIINTSGVVVEAQEYDPYGKTTFFGVSGSASVSTVGNPFGWKAVRIDPETGLLYMRHRYYSAKWGRFLSQDPLGIWGDVASRGNAYQYAVADPMTISDPYGLQVTTGGAHSPVTGSVPWLGPDGVGDPSPPATTPAPAPSPVRTGPPNSANAGNGAASNIAALSVALSAYEAWDRIARAGEPFDPRMVPYEDPRLDPEFAPPVPPPVAPPPIPGIPPVRVEPYIDPGLVPLPEPALPQGEDPDGPFAVDPCLPTPKAGQGSSPGRDHNGKSGPQKRERFMKKAKKKREEKEQERKDAEDVWERMTDFEKRVRKEKNPKLL